MKGIQKMNNTVRMLITLDTCDKIITSMNDLEFEVLMIEGTLLDSYFIKTDKTVQLFNYKPRKYIMINSIYRNTWTSDLELVLTDCDETAAEWLANYVEYTRELERY